MKTLVISIAILMSLASCSTLSSKNNQVENKVSFGQMGNDTIFDFENQTVGKLPFRFMADVTGKAENIKWSIVNDNGNNVVGAEAFTGWPTNSMYTEDPAFLKKSADGCFTSGVNRLILHYWVHQPFGDQYQPGMGMGWWGTHFGRNQTWFEPGKAFIAYLDRCQFLLQQDEQPGTYLCIDKPHGFSDVIAAEDFLSAEISVKNGRITLPSGREYPLLIYTDDLMLPAMAKKVSDLVQQGAFVAGPRPLHAPGLQNYPQ